MKFLQLVHKMEKRFEVSAKGDSLFGFRFLVFGGNVKTFVKFNGKMYTKARFGVKGVGSLGRWRCEDGLGD